MTVTVRPWKGRVVITIHAYPEQRDDRARLDAASWHVWTDHHWPGPKV